MTETLLNLLPALGGILAVLIAAPVTFMLMVWFERRVLARMQDRLGPNRVGPAGLLQSVADGVKMFTKEDIVPRAADRTLHAIAPVLAAAPVLLAYAVLPWGRGLVPVELPSGVLYVAAVTSVSALGLLIAGWASSNSFSLLGAMRAVAQMVSYEIPAVFALLAAVIMYGTMALHGMPDAQAGVPLFGMTLGPDLGLGWLVFTPVGLLGFGLFFIAALAEGERTPFDIPEADSEIIAGYMTEYSGMKFAVFYLGQFLLNYALAMVAATVFLGGWNGPGVAQLAVIPGWGGIAATLLSLLYMLLKTWGLFFVMVWLRGAFPRLRADQLMGFAWKFCIPLALINVLSASLWIAVLRYGLAPAWTLPVGWLGWLEAASPAMRQGVALLLTGAINVAAYRWIAGLNRREDQEATPVAGRVLRGAPASPLQD